MSGGVRHSVDAGLAWLRLDRPQKRNALTVELLEAFVAAVDEAAADRRVRAVLLAGEGPVFCAGMDLRAVPLEDPDTAALFARRLAAAYRALLLLDKPLLAAVRGGAFGGGVGLAAAADLVLAGEARFALPEVRLGLVPALVSVVLRQRVLPAKLRGLLLSGREVNVEEGASVGLVDVVVEDGGAVDDEAERRARQLLENSAAAMAATKAILRATTLATLEAELDAAVKTFCDAVRTPDARAGLAAYRRGDRPDFSEASA